MGDDCVPLSSLLFNKANRVDLIEFVTTSAALCSYSMIAVEDANQVRPRMVGSGNERKLRHADLT